MTGVLISVVMATFNSEKTVVKAVESVLKQSVSDFELIVVDGLSNDRTVDLLSQIEDSRLKVHSESDRGIYDAWNKGVQRASGEWILFIGSDDYLYNDRVFSNFLKGVQTKQRFDKSIFYGKIISERFDGRMTPPRGGKWENPWGVAGNYLWARFPLPIMSAFFHKTCFSGNCIFDAELKIVSDMDLVLKVAKYNEPVFLDNLIVTVMGYGGISTNPKTSFVTFKESLIVRKRNGLSVLNYELCKIASKNLVKIFVIFLFGEKKVRSWR